MMNGSRYLMIALLMLVFLACDRRSGPPRGGRADDNSNAASPASPQTPTSIEDDTLASVIQLTSGFERAGEAYFSPDMKWIIFQAAAKGQGEYDMYVAPLKKNDAGDIADLGAPTRISREGAWNSCGYFSPDGASLIFATTADRPYQRAPSGFRGGRYEWAYPETAEIHRADNWKQALAGAEGGAVDLGDKPITDHKGYDAESAFSPDGKWICFTSQEAGDLDVYVMKADGSGKVRITTEKGQDGGPFFSPDGKRLVYRSDRVGDNMLQVYVAELSFDDQGNITGRKSEKQLTEEHLNWAPYWHPDGKHLIYGSSAHGHQNYELYLMRDDGSRKMRITYGEGADVLPVFSPDGKYLMWSSKRAGDGTTQIFIAKFLPPAGW